MTVALKGRIPRALKSHRSREGRAYGAYCRAKIARHGKLPQDAIPILREAGLIVVELGRLHEMAETAWSGRRRRDASRLRRQIVIQRTQLVFLERRLEELVNGDGHGLDLERLLKGNDDHSS